MTFLQPNKQCNTMSAKRKLKKAPKRKTVQDPDSSDDEPNNVIATTNEVRRENTNNVMPRNLGISQTNVSTRVIDHPTLTTRLNAEIQQNSNENNTVDKSHVGITNDVISVSDRTGNTSSLSEADPHASVTDYISALFRFKKFITSLDELQHKGKIAMFFYQKLDITERLQEGWWAGTKHKVRKGIDSKRSTVAMAIKNEFMSKFS
jgi:hypothetical protein